MDYTAWSESQSQHSQTPLSSYPSAPPLSSYPLHYLAFPPNPNHSSSALPTLPVEPPHNPTGVNSCVPLNNNPGYPIASQVHPPIPNLPHGHTQLVSNTLVPSSGHYVEDPNAQNQAAREAARQYGVNPFAYASGIPMPLNGSAIGVTDPNSAWWTNTAVQPHGNGTQNKRAREMVYAFCEVCTVECTSKEMLDQHNAGKRHMKNLEKLRRSLLDGMSNSVGRSIKKCKTQEDVERKKSMVIECGAAAEDVRVCEICKLVCSSPTNFNDHLAGYKHAAMLRKVSAQQPSIAS